MKNQSIRQTIGYFKNTSYVCMCFSIVKNLSNLVTLYCENADDAYFPLQCYNHFVDLTLHHCIK